MKIDGSLLVRYRLDINKISMLQILVGYLKFEDITFYNFSIYHYNLNDKLYCIIIGYTGGGMMNPNTRACVAFVAGRLISGQAASSVYDYSQSKYVSIDGNVKSNNVDVYDYDRGCHFGGSGNGKTFDLYDYGGSHHVELKINGSNFEGYDYGASCHFSGDVRGGDISLYDYGESTYFNYSL